MKDNLSDDNNPATAKLTESLLSSTLRFLYNDDTHFDWKLSEPVLKDQAHPYLQVDRTKLKAVLVLNSEGTEVGEPIVIPAGFTVGYRMRTRNVGGVVEKFIVIGVVNRKTQVLHFIYRDGTTEKVDTPTEFAKYGKINPLRTEESV